MTLSAAAYFLMIVAVMLYLCMVLLGRRHWHSGWQQRDMAFHYLLRAVALVVVAGRADHDPQRHDLRGDMTTEQLSSLSPQTQKLLAGLKLDRPVQIEAFISPVVPETYVQTRLNLLAMLRELETRGGAEGPCPCVRHRTLQRTRRPGGTRLRHHSPSRRNRAARRRGSESIFMGVAMTCGRQKVVVPFIDRGIPVEYELVRSLSTVAQQNRPRVGVINTDAPLFGHFNMQSMSPGQNWPIIDELQKQYEVVQVDASKPIKEKFDVLLAVQPSTLPPDAMENFIDAIKSGRPRPDFRGPLPGLGARCGADQHAAAAARGE